MATFITLLSWTMKGAETAHESPNRLARARDLARKFGGEIREFYMTLGRHDFVAVGEFPDDEAYTKFAVAVARLGTVKTESLRAFKEDEYRTIIADATG